MNSGFIRGLIAVAFLFLFLLPTHSADEKSEEEKDKIQSITADRKDILQFGIEDEVSGLLDALKEEKDESSLDDAFSAFQMGVSPKLKAKFLEYFKELEHRGAEEIVINDLLEYEELDATYRLSAITYLSTGMNPQAVEVYRLMLESDEAGIVRAAVKALGGSGTSEDAEQFLEYLDDPEFPDEVKPELILSLGELEDPIARDRLIEIIEDEYEEKSWRMYACVSLARIGVAEDVDILYRVFQTTDDPLVRSYAVSSLGYFDSEKAETALIQSLRDSFWRVRVNGAKALGERKSEEAVSILIYKATKDPEVRVRIEAIEALGNIATRDAFNAIQEIYKKEGSDMKLRSAALEALASGDIDESLSVFEGIIESQWETKRSVMLELTAKRLSRCQSSDLKPIFERFLLHPELTVKIHGIRGIRHNQFSGLKSKIEELSSEGNHRSIRKEALAALEVL